MKAALPIFAALSLSGCAVGASSFAVSTASATIPFAGVAAIGPVAVRPLALIEDSRCPAQVQCVWAGRLRLLAAVRHGGRGEVQRELILGTPLALPEGRLTLVAAGPEKIAGEAIAPAAYRFTFTWVRP